MRGADPPRRGLGFAHDWRFRFRALANRRVLEPPAPGARRRPRLEEARSATTL
ncbi:MAG TPA: hypothetical protein VGB47_11330 [Thermoanaerobaculia bacterium]